MHAPSETEAAADPRLRPQGHRDQHAFIMLGLVLNDLLAVTFCGIFIFQTKIQS